MPRKKQKAAKAEAEVAVALKKRGPKPKSERVETEFLRLVFNIGLKRADELIAGIRKEYEIA